MKRLFAITLLTVLMLSVFTGCSSFPFAPTPTQPSETTQATSAETAAPTETTEAAETTQEETQKVTTTDEFPTEGDEEEGYAEPQGRWSLDVPDSWYEYGDIIEESNGNRVKFVYKKAYDEYGAGHVFTIFTKNASNAVDVTELPHAEELYLDDNIQIYVEYPTDVQFGGIDGSEIEEQAPEYGALSDMKDDIINSLEVLE